MLSTCVQTAQKSSFTLNISKKAEKGTFYCSYAESTQESSCSGCSICPYWTQPVYPTGCLRRSLVALPFDSAPLGLSGGGATLPNLFLKENTAAVLDCLQPCCPASTESCLPGTGSEKQLRCPISGGPRGGM